MMKLVLNRFRTVRGAVIGRLFQEILDRNGSLIDHERICDTVEREGGNLAPGDYRVEIAKCSFHQRKMLFLHRLQSEKSSSCDEAPLARACETFANQSCACESFANQSFACESFACESSSCQASACQSCAEERKHHERGHLSALHAVKCPMFQPGNGPFTLRQGGILVGEACPPGFVIHSQDTFLQLYDRIKKVIARKGEVVVEVKEEMV